MQAHQRYVALQSQHLRLGCLLLYVREPCKSVVGRGGFACTNVDCTRSRGLGRDGDGDSW